VAFYVERMTVHETISYQIETMMGEKILPNIAKGNLRDWFKSHFDKRKSLRRGARGLAPREKTKN